MSMLPSRDVHGRPDASVLALAARNARLQTGLVNPIDEALLRACPPTVVPGGEEKLAEIPYDFVRKRLSVIVRAQKGGEDGAEGGAELLTKGAVDPILAVCTRVAGGAALDAELRARVEAGVRASCQEGLRVLAVARRSLPLRESYTRDDERDLELVGFVLLTDPPKEGVSRTLGDLRALGVGVKIISGDNHLVVLHVARAIGFECPNVLTGGDLDNLNDEALWARAERVDLFAEVDPNQKERIILALKKMGHVVGFMGDGVNDAPAMHAADTSISVESAVDVARDAADFVLLEKDLDVLRRGILAGRITFANTLKYIQTTISANLGNMISMAIASLFLPFLPLLAGQILLNNFLSDVPAFGLAGDAVDPELTTRPRRWDLRSLRRFMIRFGLLSSLFDFATFGVLLLGFRAAAPEFRTAWFLESLLTELVVALVVRTRRRFYRSRPGRLLLWSTIGVAAIAIGIPYVPVARTLGFVPLPATLLGAIVLITLGYAASAEGLKRIFYRMEEEDQAPRDRQRMPALTPKISSSAPMS
jgi:Mg2+-importing ATPase